MRVKGFADAGEVVSREPRPQQLEERLAVDPAIRLIAKIRARARLHRSEFASEPGGFAQARPLPRGQRQHHHPAAVACAEVPAKRAVHIVAEPAARLRLEDRLADQAQVTGQRESDVRQAQLDQLPFAMQPAVALGREDRDGGEVPGHAVPCGEDMVDRAVMSLRSRQPGKSESCVDRVVDRGRAVAVTGDDNHDQVPPQFR